MESRIRCFVRWVKKRQTSWGISNRSRFNRMASLTTRLTRFLWGALPMDFRTEIINREWGAPETRNLALSIPRRRYFPCWKTRSISRLARNRTELEGYWAGCLTSHISWPFPRRPFGFGPSCADALTPFGPPWFSCGRENRVSFSACGCLVETFFSYLKPNPVFPPRLIG